MSLPDVHSLLFSPSRAILLHGARVFDRWTLAWGQPSAEARPADCSEISPRDAIRALAERNLLRRVHAAANLGRPAHVDGAVRPGGI